MKEEGVKKVNMSILETEIDLITSIKNDFAIFENSSDLPVLDYPSRLEMGMMAICLRGTTRMSIDLKEYTFGANDMVIVLADQIVQQHQRSDDFLCCVFAVSIKFAQEAILSYWQFLPTLLRIKEDPRIPLKPEEVVSVLEYCSFLRQRVNMRDNCFRREIAKSLFHGFLHLTALVLPIHVDKIDQNHPGKVPQPNLPGDLPHRRHILGKGEILPAVAFHKGAAVHIHGAHGFPLVDHQVAAI